MRVGRYSFGVFVVVGVAGLVMAAQCLFAPLGFLEVLRGVAGVDVSAIASRDPEAARGFVFFARWTGTVLLGSDGLTLIVALTAYRRGARWAWWAMWYWPALFICHALLYRPGSGLFYLQFVNLALATAAQLASYTPQSITAPTDEARRASGYSS